MDIIPRDMPADDLQAFIRSTQAELDAVAATPAMRREPLRLIMTALSGVLGVFGRSITRWERAVADVIAARDPLTEDDRASLVEAVQKGAYDGMRKEARRMVRTLDRRLAVTIGLLAGGAYALGAVSVIAMLVIGRLGPFSREAGSQTAWRDLILNNPDPRPAIASAEIRADHAGRRFYSGLSLWMDTARPPSAGQ